MSREISKEIDGYTLHDNLRITAPIIHKLEPRDDAVSMGDLEPLPTEILDMVISNLDLNAIVQLRGVNVRARAVVDAHPQYSTIFRHAPLVLCSLHQSQCAVHTVCQMLYDKLHSYKCERCHRDGPYLFIPTCTRVCRNCFLLDDDFAPVPYETAIEISDFSNELLKAVPIMTVSAGEYGFFNRSPINQSFVVSHKTLLEAILANDARLLRLGSPLMAGGMLYELFETVRRGAFAFLSMESRQKPLQWKRFLCVTRIPWVCRETKTAYHGFYCDRCSLFEPFNASFAEEGLPGHALITIRGASVHQAPHDDKP